MTVRLLPLLLSLFVFGCEEEPTPEESLSDYWAREGQPEEGWGEAVTEGQEPEPLAPGEAPRRPPLSEDDLARAGRAEAESQIADGRLRLIGDKSREREAAEAYRRRLSAAGIDYVVHGAEGDELDAYERAYNERMTEAIDEQFGTDYLAGEWERVEP